MDDQGVLRRIAITGVDGFVGRHVAALASRQGLEVVGLGHKSAPRSDLMRDLSEYYPADLRTEWPLTRPVDAIIHLAGLAAVLPSYREPQRYIEWNSAIVTTMCEGILAAKWPGPVRVLGVSTGAVYASQSSDAPLDERASIAANSPYVISKLLTEHQFEYYARRGIDAVVVRPFNHIGPGQATGFLVPDLTAKLLAARSGEPLHVGNLATERDYTDVRDVAAAYLLLAEAPDHSEFVYNVASGQSVSGTEMLALICDALDMTTPVTETDASLLRATESQRVTGSAQRIATEFGWKPGIPIEQSVRDFVGSV
jgi:GDP-4-dehydro-6-deoxy-D-mannose reductase